MRVRVYDLDCHGAVDSDRHVVLRDHVLKARETHAWWCYMTHTHDSATSGASRGSVHLGRAIKQAGLEAAGEGDFVDEGREHVNASVKHAAVLPERLFGVSDVGVKSRVAQRRGKCERTGSLQGPRRTDPRISISGCRRRNR